MIFLLHPGHFGNYIRRLLILRKSCILSISLLRCKFWPGSLGLSSHGSLIFWALAKLLSTASFSWWCWGSRSIPIAAICRGEVLFWVTCCHWGPSGSGGDEQTRLGPGLPMPLGGKQGHTGFCCCHDGKMPWLWNGSHYGPGLGSCCYYLQLKVSVWAPAIGQFEFLKPNMYYQF